MNTRGSAIWDCEAPLSWENSGVFSYDDSDRWNLAVNSEKNSGLLWRRRPADDFSGPTDCKIAGETPALRHRALNTWDGSRILKA
jgi:hypothetical protein